MLNKTYGDCPNDCKKCPKLVSQIKQSILKAIEEEVKIKIWQGIEFQETSDNPMASRIYKLGSDKTLSVIKEILGK